MNRRQFLLRAGTAAALISLPVLATPTQAADPAPSTTDVGPLSDYSKDGVTSTWAPRSKGAFFVIRTDGRLFAASSLCTHRNAQLVVKNDELFCPRHKSEFSFEGTVTNGPAKRSLPRYAIHTDPAGHVVVDTSKSFSESEWDDPASFIPVKG